MEKSFWLCESPASARKRFRTYVTDRAQQRPESDAAAARSQTKPHISMATNTPVHSESDVAVHGNLSSQGALGVNSSRRRGNKNGGESVEPGKKKKKKMADGYDNP